MRQPLAISDDLGPLLDGRGLRIGVVASRFNEQISNHLLKACLDELGRLGTAVERTKVVRVAGALEIPLTVQCMAQRGIYDAIIALGAIIRGETYHFEVVANESVAMLSRVSLEYGVPIANGLLTVENQLQAQCRQETKGVEVARVAVEMAHILKNLTDPIHV